MLTLKKFHKKTRKGSIVKVVREHYLRDDIACGIIPCCKCEDKSSVGDINFDNVINRTPISEVFNEQHVLIIDSDVATQQMDILEDAVFQNVIIPQTAWDEVKHKSPPAYKKLRDCVFGNPEKSFVVFANDLHKDTFVERMPKENSPDYCKRSVRKLASWFKQHLEDQFGEQIKVVLLTSLADSKDEAIKESIICFTLNEYVSGIKSKPELADKLALVPLSDAKSGTASKRYLFSQHKSLTDIQTGLKGGQYKQGSFQVSRDNYLEAFVYVDGLEKPVFIQGLANCNRAVHEDVVAIEMLPESEWSCPAKLLKIRDLEEKANADSVEDDFNVADDEDKEFEKARNNLREPTGCVVAIIRRNWRPYCGIILKSAVPGARRHLFSPAERRVPRIRMETRQVDELEGQRLVVCIDGWSRESRYPTGHLIRVLGPLGDKDTENEVLLLEHDVAHGSFSQSVLECLPKLPWVITPDDEAAREDLRHLDICSVDPPGCTDIDDALHCRTLADSTIEVGVHIADVSHFVRPGTAMDLEAASRGTTVYLVDKRIDMLPDLLSSNLCSLRGGEDRFAFSVIWQVTKDAEIISKRFTKSIIKSRAALTYAEAQSRIDDLSLKDSVSKSLRWLNKLAKKLKERRKATGALSLASLEIKFNIDTETHDPIAVQDKEILETNSMIEEFMLLANITVAEFIYGEFPDCAVLRRHPIPAPSSYKPVSQAASTRGFDIKIDSGKALSESLDRARIENNPFFNTMLRILTTRCMTQAVYFASGTIEKRQFFHFGLATPMYTHFTSPIRRYADLLVHRFLAVALRADSPHLAMLDKRKVEEICKNLNYRHRNAQLAGRASVLLNTHLYFKDKVEVLVGYVLMIKKNALQVLIPKYGLESPILFGKDSPMVFNEEEGTVSAKTDEGMLKLRMFDRLQVQISVDRKDVQHEKLLLQLVEPRIPNFSVEPAFDAAPIDDVFPMRTR